MYKIWASNFDKKKHVKILETCKNFINSKDHKLLLNHLVS